MGIYLSGGDIHVAKHHLDRTEIRSSFQEMTPEGMAEEVRGDSFPNTCLSAISLDIFPDLLPAYPSA
jgi:hypothetical protein